MTAVNDLAAFYAARLDEIEAAAQGAQAADPAPWKADAHDDGSTWERTGHGAGLVVAADDTALWDCEGSNVLCMTAPTARHVALHDPAYVLADIATKRRLLAEYQWALNQALPAGPAEPSAKGMAEFACTVAACQMLEVAVYVLAAAHDGHPDFNPDWAPKWPSAS